MFSRASDLHSQLMNSSIFVFESQIRLKLYSLNMAVPGIYDSDSAPYKFPKTCRILDCVITVRGEICLHAFLKRSHGSRGSLVKVLADQPESHEFKSNSLSTSFIHHYG